MLKFTCQRLSFWSRTMSFTQTRLFIHIHDVSSQRLWPAIFHHCKKLTYHCVQPKALCETKHEELKATNSKKRMPLPSRIQHVDFFPTWDYWCRPFLVHPFCFSMHTLKVSFDMENNLKKKDDSISLHLLCMGSDGSYHTMFPFRSISDCKDSHSFTCTWPAMCAVWHSAVMTASPAFLTVNKYCEYFKKVYVLQRFPFVKTGTIQIGVDHLNMWT